VYESFYVPTATRSIINVTGTNELASNQSENLVAKANEILKSLVKVKVSTDYDSKERLFNNYASVIDQNSNPVLLMEFDPFNYSANLNILWLNPSGKFPY
jgi:hypothetical protein